MLVKNLSNSKIYIGLLIVCFCVAAFIGCFFRLYPLKNFTPNDSTEKATVFVLSKLRGQINEQVDRTHAKLPTQQKDLLKKKLFDKMLSDEADNVRQSIEDISEKINAQTNGGANRNSPYLLASDSFYYYGLTENIIKDGAIAETIKGSKYLHPKMLAPVGHWEPFNLHPYLGYNIYRFLKIFKPDIELMHAVSFTPLFIATLSLIPFFIICFILNVTPAASLTGALFLSLAPVFIKRSAFGWYDNDPYNVLFPLMILTLVFLGFTSLNNQRKTIVIGLITSLLVMIYAFFWQGWVLLFSLVMICLFGAMIINTVQNTNRRNTLIYFAVTLLGSFTAISIAFGFSEFLTLFREGAKALGDFLNPKLALWPNIYLSVGELNRVSFEKITKQLGGQFFVYAGMIGCALSLAYALYEKNKPRFFSVLTIAVFIAATFIITKGAQRFAMLCLAPLALGFTLGLSDSLRLLINILPKIKAVRYASIGIVSALFLGLTIIPIKHLQTSMASILNPIYNDTWNEAMTVIRTQTPEESIINTWWPPGHFIKTMGQRKVTFDGATINFPQAYWMANVFLATEEKEALGILRMLNNSANQAAEYLQELGLPLSKAVEILKTAVSMDQQSAKIFLMTTLKSQQHAQKVLSLTHSTPAPSYLMIFNELVANNLQFPFIGNWNFKQIETINSRPDLLAEVPSSGSKNYIPFLWKLAGGPYHYSGPLGLISLTGEYAYFQHNVAVNLNTKDCEINSSGDKKVPLSIFYEDNGVIVEKKFANANMPFSVLLYKDRGNYASVILDRRLAQSLLIRLYFFEGTGLKHFKPFKDISDLTGRTNIKLFSISW